MTPAPTADPSKSKDLKFWIEEPSASDEGWWHWEVSCSNTRCLNYATLTTGPGGLTLHDLTILHEWASFHQCSIVPRGTAFRQHLRG